LRRAQLIRFPCRAKSPASVSLLQHVLQPASIPRIFWSKPRQFRGRLAPPPRAINRLLNIGLEGRRGACFNSAMSTTLIEIRRAKASDATAIASTHDEAWRAAYQGIIPGPELDKLINRRGANWWDSAIRKGSRISILGFGEMVAGYANYGRNRARSLYYDGEIYELYLRPEFQGLGFGHKLFTSVRRDLTQSGLQHGGVGFVGQRPGARVLPLARRQGGGPLLRALRHPHPRQGRLRLEQLSAIRVRDAPRFTPSPRVRGEGGMRTPHHLARGILRGGNPAKGCVGVVP
jgi:GNAT superfamily N-acetyltransferase